MTAKPTEKVDPRTEKRLKDLGEKLKRTRKRLGISREKLAQKLGMHLMNYARIEQGKQNVTIEMLGRIVDGLGVKVVIVLEPSEPEPKPSSPSKGRPKLTSSVQRRPKSFDHS